MHTPRRSAGWRTSCAVAGTVGRSSSRNWISPSSGASASSSAPVPTTPGSADRTTALRDHDLLARLPEADGERFARRLTRRTYRAGEMVVRRGEIARELFLVTRGQLSVVLDLPSGGSRRLATLSAGMTFGELAFLEGERRTADVRADTATECHVLTATEYTDLGRTDPGLRAALLEGLLRTVGRTARRMTDELAQLAS